MAAGEKKIYQYSREIVIKLNHYAALISFALISKETMAYAVTQLLIEFGISKMSEARVENLEETE